MQKKCPKCGYERQPKDDDLHPTYECPKCGIIYEKAEKKLLDESNSNEAEQENDFSNRIVCSDGNCIGIIGKDGLCKACKRPHVKTDEIIKEEKNGREDKHSEGPRLTQEEKQKIYEEEKCRAEARINVEKERKQEEFKKGCTIGCLAFILLLFIGYLFTGNSAPSACKTAEKYAWNRYAVATGGKAVKTECVDEWTEGSVVKVKVNVQVFEGKLIDGGKYVNAGSMIVNIKDGQVIGTSNQ